MKSLKLEEPKNIENLKDIEDSPFHRNQQIIFKCKNCSKIVTRYFDYLRKTNFEQLCKSCKNSKTQKSFSQELKKQIQEKRKQTCLNEFGVENPSQNIQSKQKREQTCLEKYKTKNPLANSEIRNKCKDTCKNKYGKETFLASEIGQQTFRKNMLKKYGVENYSQLDESKERLSKHLSTVVENYYQNNKENWAQLHSRKLYQFKNQTFDSFPELCFYIFQKENGQNIKRCEKSFNYTFNDIEHSYFPDFEIIDKDENSQFFELKGDQFLTESGKWQNPFDHSQDEFYEAKHRCAIQNNVHILYQKDYQKYIDYVKQKYTKEQLQSFKVEKKQTN